MRTGVWARIARVGVPLRVFAAFLLIVVSLALITVATVVTPPPAAADQATGGSGRFKSIEWFSWGAHGTEIPNAGLTRTQTYTVAGQTLAVTCSISGITGAGTGNLLQSYRSGTWRGDGFDDLYNIGGTGTSNQLVAGVSNRLDGGTVNFNFNCSATLGGNPLPLSGLVMADAESSGGTEHVAATIPSTATWRIIDRVRGATCTNDSYARRTQTATTQTLALYGEVTNTCENVLTTSPAPAAVAFMEGATSATRVEVSGAGTSAIALGVALDFDFGDAPSTYGQAVNGVQYAFTGGTVPLWDGVSRGTPVFGSLTLAQATQPPQRLGTVVDPELSQPFTAAANGDDLAGSSAFGGPDDEESVTPPSPIVVTPGQQYTLPNVVCRGTTPIAAWIDFDINGTFDADERSGVVPCNGTSVSLTWTVPADAVPGAGIKPTFMRVRMVEAGATPQPTGLSNGGEIEDYAVNIAEPPLLTLSKSVAGRVAPTDQFTVTAAGPGLPAGGASATTSGTGTSATTGSQVVQAGQTYTLTDSMAAGSANPLSDYVATIRCIDAANGGATVATTGSSPTWSVSNLTVGQDVRCTITNTPRAAAIDISKTAGTTSGPDATGSYTATYTVKVDNTGALGGTYGALTDTPAFASNIVVDSASWTTSGTGAPAGGSATGSGPFTLAPAGTAIARDTVHTYTVTIKYHYTNRTTATACSGPGTGLYNSVALPAGQESGSTTNNSACMAPAPAPAPSIALDKTASPLRDLDGNGPDAGDRIDYSFAVTNTGNVNVNTLSISDPLVPVISCPVTFLAPGATTTCTGSYTLTQTDVERGTVTNTATASGRDPQGATVTSAPDSTTTSFAATASLLLDKTAGTPVDANNSGRTDAGDTIRYQFTVTNSGAITMSNIAVTDSKLSGVTCTPTTLAPGATATCTAPLYTITQADIDAGSVNNTATANGTTPSGTRVNSNPDSTSTPLNAVSSLSVDKVAAAPVDVNKSGLTDAGDTIRYSFSVTNNGTVTLSGLKINDAKLAAAGITITCTPTTLAPGATATCTTSAPYVVTKADEDAGVVANTATASATSPGGTNVVSPPDSTSTPTTRPQPALSVDKVAAAPVDANNSGITDAGDTIRYSFTVTNSGNVPISGVAINDAKLAAAGITITCTPTTLAVGASATCTTSAPYKITSADVSSGSVSNTATATGRDPNQSPVTSPPDSTATPTTTPSAQLTVDKIAGTPVDANNSGITDAGDTIRYSFTVTNSGNVPISGVAINDAKLAAAGITITCTPTTLAVGATATCTTSAPYRITAADVTAGSAANTATATGRDPDGGTVTSPSDSTSTPTTAPAPRLTIDKTAGTPVDVNNSGITDAGDTIRYSFTVTNSGNVPISSVRVTDAKLTGAGITITCPTGPLAVGATVTCTTSGPYTVTEADEASGSVANSATASGTNPDGGTVTSPPDTTSTPVTAPQTGLLLDKQAGVVSDLDGNGTDAGDTIAYTFTVTNTGNVPLTNVRISDAKLTGAGLTITCPATPLAPGATVSCTVSGPYVLTAADLNAGSVNNTATSTATDPDGAGVTSPPDSTSTQLDQRPGLSLTKNASAPEDVNGSGITDAGDHIGYSFVVTNTGNVEAVNIRISDPKLTGAGITITCPATRLAAGDNMTCVASPSYTITAADVASGSVANTATALGESPPGTAVQSNPSSTSTPTTAPAPSLNLEKSAAAPVDANNSGITDAGDTIVYTFTVTNTGNVPISGVKVSDAKLTGAGRTITCPSAPLAPGASVTCTVDAPYTVTAADVASGAVSNTATASGTNPDGGTVTSPPDSTSTPTTAPAPALNLEKSAAAPVDVNNSGITDAGDTITYTFTVTNTGNVPVRQVTVNDAKLTGAGLTITCPTGPLAPGASVTCTVSSPYTITEADEQSGAVDNTATASGLDPDGKGVTSPPDSTSTPTAAPEPSLSIDKRAAAPVDVNNSGITDAGDTVQYSFTVTNTGNVPIRQVTVSDAKLTRAGLTITCPTGPLAPGASVECTVSGPYTITAQDVTDGAATNTATASGIDPDGGTVTSPEDSTTTPTTEPEPTLIIDKTAEAPVDVNASGNTDAGDTIRYSFTVTNTGNVPIRAIGVVDPKLTDAGITISCPPGPLAPGATVTCTTSGPYTVTAADVEAGAVANTATARGTDPDGHEVASPPDSTTTPTTAPAPRLLIDKEAGDPVDVNNSGLTDAGDTIAYTFTVTNTGNVPIRQVNVTDAMLTDAGLTISCPPGPLAPGASVTCTVSGPYTITEADEAAGEVTNTATASGIDPDGGNVESDPDTTTTPTSIPGPALTVDKSAANPVDVNNSGITDAGDTVQYSFTVTNNGNVPIREITISDAKLTDAGLTITCPTGPLAPGASVACTVSGPYTITAQDVEDGAAINTATASGIDPDGGDVTSPEDSTTTPTTTPAPSLSIDKQAAAPVDVNNSGITDAGDTIRYSFTVNNEGNVPIRQVNVTDAMLADAGITIDCPVGPLAPGASVTCTTSGPYTITENDETAGAVTNSATAGGIDPDGGDVTSPPDSTTTPTTAPAPSLVIDKRAAAPVDVNNSGNTDAGDTVQYSFTVTNTGNVPIRQVAVNDPKLTNAGLTIDCPAGPLAPGASVDCTVSGPYTITAADVANGAATNTATASGIDPDGGDVTSPSDSTTTPTTTPAPSLVIDKQAAAPVDVNNSGITDAGDTIRYSFTVTNTGNVPIRQVAVTDAKLTDAGLTIDCPAGPLAPGASVDCTVSGPYTVTEADEAAGEVANTATASGVDPDGGDVTSPSDSTTTPTTVPAPRLLLDKEAGAPVDVNDSGLTDAGDTIRYTFTVTNTGNVPIRQVAVSDPMLADAGLTIDCPAGPLAPGASVTCTVSGPYTITEADETAGEVTNTATASGIDPDGADVGSDPDSTTTPTSVPGPALTVDKSAADPVDVNNSGITDAGDTVQYSFTVTNNGNVPIRQISISDAKLEGAGLTITCPVGPLAPGASVDCTVSGPYTITAADVADGAAINTATASGIDPDGGPVTSPEDSTTTPTTAPVPSLGIDKTAAAPVDVNNSGITDAGDTIRYSFTVTNTGNVPIRQVRVSDAMLADAGITIDCPAGPLAPGETISCTTSGPYTITEADEQSGSVVNTATAGGIDPDGGDVTSPQDSTTTPTVVPAPSLGIDKRAAAPVDVNNSGITDAGDTIRYSFTVTNTGNVPIRQVSVTDAKLTSAGLTIDCPTGPLAPGASVDCTVSGPYTITASDVANGAVENTATASGIDPDNGDVTSTPDSTTTPTTAPAPSLTIDKSAAAPVDVNNSGITDAGDTIRYSFTVTNTGNVPIRQVSVTDAKLTDAGLTITCPTGPLAPGASVDCTVSGPYTVTEADEAAGEVANTATASGIDPDGGNVTSPSDSTTTPTTVPAPALSIDKSAAAPVDVNNSGLTDAGDTIRYTFTVTNEGNVPIRQVSVTDAKLTNAGITIDCPVGPLAPGETITCTTSGPYTVTEADEQSGAVVNTATASGIDPDGGDVTSPSDSTSTPTTTPAPSLVLDKQAAAPVDVNNSGITDAGDTIQYTFTVTNTGNVPIRQISVTDAKLTGAGLTIDCPAGPLAPDASVTCTVSGPYTITEADEQSGAVANTATASGIDPDGGDVTSPQDSTTTPTTVPAPSLVLDKQAAAPVDVNNSGLTDAGDTIAYTFTVTNDGNVPIRQVAVSDAMLEGAGITIDCPAGPLAPGASVTCTTSAPYTVTEADEQSGAVVNTATASGIDPDGGDVTSPQDSTTTPTTVPAPELSIDKSAAAPVDVNNSGLTDAGDTIRYTFTVTNTGNVPIRQVAVNDAKLTNAGITIDCPTGPLAPGASVTCTTSAPYTVTEADEQSGAVVNTATASGIDPDGGDVTSPSDSTSTPTTVPAPRLLIDKEAGQPVDVNESGLTDAGDTIAYTFTVTNTGNVPIRQVSVTDAKLTDAGLTITCPAGPLAPGASVTCTVSGPYTITEADEAAGEVANTATASGIDPDGADVTSPSDSTTTPTSVPGPALTIDKRAADPVDKNNSGITDAGDTVQYSFTVTNNGNVPIRQITISDPKLTNAGLTITCPTGRLAVGASVECTVSGPYTITAADVRDGAAINTATASGVDPDGGDVTSPEDSTTTPTTAPAPSLTIDKQAAAPVDENESGLTDAGDTIAYTFTVTNTGNVPIRQVRVTDAKLTNAGLTITCPAGPLAPGESVDCTVSGPYTVTEADEQAGSVDNTATASGVDPDGGDVTSPSDSTTTPTTVPAPRLLIDKEAAAPVDVNDSGLTDAGDTIRYTFTVTNTGNVPISDVSVTDAKLTNAGLTIDCPTGPLAPGASVTCTVSGPYTITKADEAAGEVANTATASGTDPDGGDVTSPSDSTTTPTSVPGPALTVDKSAAAPVDANNSGITDAGDTIQYSFTVTNNGNVPIRQITIDDPKLTGAGLTITCPTGRLAVGASVECTVSGPYTITAADVRDGAAINTATASGIDPDGGTVTSPEDSTTTPTTTPAPALGIDKRAADPVDVNNSGITDAGDTIRYSFTVTNTGNVPIRQIAVNDAMLAEAGITIDCPTGPLAPGDAVTCTTSGPYTITAADVEAGSVDNTATASGIDPDGSDVTSPSDSTTTPTTAPAPGLELDKAAGKPTDENGDGRIGAGDTITFTFTVTNTGNVPIHDVAVDDPMLAAAGVTVDCPDTPVAPGAGLTCTAEYALTQADVDAGVVRNTATASGENPDGDPVGSNEDSTTTNLDPTAELTLVKDAELQDENGDGVGQAGEQVLYTFTVTNTGTVTVSEVAIEDALLAGHGVTPTCDPTTLAPGEEAACEATMTLEAGDVKSSPLVNVATATGLVTTEECTGRPVKGSGAAPCSVESAPDDAQVPVGGPDEPTPPTATPTPTAPPTGTAPTTPSDPGGTLLPDTGGASVWWLLLGFLLTCGGLGALVTTRRKKES